jgi:ribosome-associated toxin RatA of RatAB toxin-antitoxin module
MADSSAPDLLKKLAVSSETMSALLANGELAFVEDSKNPGDPKYVTVVALFNAPIEKVFETVTDYEHYVGRIPQLAETKVLSRNGNELSVLYKIEFKFSIITQKADYVLKTVLDPPRSITGIRTSGSISKAEGSWNFIPAAGGKKTIGIYRSTSDIRSMGRVVRYMLDQQPPIAIAIATSSAIVYVKAMGKWIAEVSR